MPIWSIVLTQVVLLNALNIYFPFGVPHKIISDNGPAFRAEQFKAFLHQSNIQHSPSSIYYPQGNGVVERLHRSLKGRLDKLLEEGQDLEESIQHILMDIRSSLSASTGQTPFGKLFGREMRAPWHICVSSLCIVITWPQLCEETDTPPWHNMWLIFCSLISVQRCVRAASPQLAVMVQSSNIVLCCYIIMMINLDLPHTVTAQCGLYIWLSYVGLWAQYIPRY